MAIGNTGHDLFKFFYFYILRKENIVSAILRQNLVLFLAICLNGALTLAHTRKSNIMRYKMIQYCTIINCVFRNKYNIFNFI